MSYIVHYDIAALIITLVVACHFAVKQSIPSRQTTMFAWMLGLAALANVLDLVTIYTIEHPSVVPVWLNTFLNQLYLISFNGVAAFYYAYLVSWSKKMRDWTTWNYVRALLPYSLVVILILSTPYTNWIFYFDENDIYHRGPWLFLLYLEAIYYMIAAIIQVIVHRATMSKTQKVIVLVFTSSAFLAIIVQHAIPNLMIVHLAIAISAVLMYLALQNPENYYNQQFGTFNRMAFHEMFNTYSQHNKQFFILGIQINGLSFINETHGVGAGNLLLQQIAEYLQQISGISHVFHLSGTKFLIMMPCKDTEKYEFLISKILKRFKNAFMINGIKCAPEVSLCILNCVNSNITLEDALDMITYSLREAEGKSDDSVIIATEDILEKGRRESRLLQLMKNALLENKFEVYYQPIYSVKDQRFTMAEALIRLKDDSGVFISPDEFIPLAEKNGLILDIGEYVFREVCRFTTTANLAKYGLQSVDVNLSAVQCMQRQLHSKLTEIMDEFGVDYHFISLEITETAAVMSSETLRLNMNELIEKGINFSLDDYGTGFSNMATIIEYPFHTIKIDKSLVWSAMEKQKSLSALKHSINMVKDMNMELVAEGVETLEQTNMLKDMGCDYFQGYYYSKPLPGKEFLKLLSSQKDENTVVYIKE